MDSESTANIKQRKKKSAVDSPPSSPTTDRQNGEKKEKRRKRDMKQEDAPQKSSPIHTAVKVIGLVSLIPLVLSIPWLLSHTSTLIKNHQVCFRTPLILFEIR